MILVTHQARLDDPEIGCLLSLWEQSADKPPWQAVSALPLQTKVYWGQWQSLSLENGVLYWDYEMPVGDRVVKQLIPPQKFWTQVLRQLHDSISGGHLGVNNRGKSSRGGGPIQACNQWCTCSLKVVS